MVYTTAEAAQALTERNGIDVPDWKVRRVVDALGVEVRRVGLYRVIPESLLDRVETELRRQGWFERGAAHVG